MVAALTTWLAGRPLNHTSALLSIPAADTSTPSCRCRGPPALARPSLLHSEKRERATAPRGHSEPTHALANSVAVPVRALAGEGRKGIVAYHSRSLSPTPCHEASHPDTCPCYRPSALPASPPSSILPRPFSMSAQRGARHAHTHTCAENLSHARDGPAAPAAQSSGQRAHLPVELHADAAAREVLRELPEGFVARLGQVYMQKLGDLRARWACKPQRTGVSWARPQ